MGEGWNRKNVLGRGKINRNLVLGVTHVLKGNAHPKGTIRWRHGGQTSIKNPFTWANLVKGKLLVCLLENECYLLWQIQETLLYETTPLATKPTPAKFIPGWILIGRTRGYPLFFSGFFRDKGVGNIREISGQGGGVIKKLSAGEAGRNNRKANFRPASPTETSQKISTSRETF